MRESGDSRLIERSLSTNIQKIMRVSRVDFDKCLEKDMQILEIRELMTLTYAFNWE